MGLEREYSIHAHLIRHRDEAEWLEEMPIWETSLEKAHKVARTFAREQAKLNGAVIVDYYAVDLETNEYSEKD